jgi:acyl-CoA synthetase (AMP-forming)/AMP-acid ligase II
VLIAGDGLDRRLRDRAVDRGLRVEHYYGATELSLVAWGSCRDDLRLFDEVEVRIEDGRIWVRSPWLSDGPAPDSPVGPWRRGEDGFVSIGDRGRLEGDLLMVSGRAGAITTGGVTVELAPLAERLREAAAGEIHLVGIPHPVVGQVLGCAVSRPDDIERLRSWSHSHLAPAERPREWAVIARPPLTAAGKLDMDALAALIHGHGVAGRHAEEAR